MIKELQVAKQDEEKGNQQMKIRLAELQSEIKKKDEKMEELREEVEGQRRSFEEMKVLGAIR